MPFSVVLGESDESVFITDEVINHFLAHQQLRKNQTEAGGQLFGTISGKIITIHEATGPRKTDRRTRYSYFPDRKAEQREISDRFSRGVHFIGDWHTHPEPRANPSSTDLSNMRECVKRSQRAVLGFLLVIVGTNSLPSSLHISLHDGVNALYLAITQESGPSDISASPL